MDYPDGFRPKVFVGLPFYGQAPVQCSLAAQTTLMEGGDCDMAGFGGHSISSLVNCFNTLWVEALNLRDRGEATHFAMLHSDCQPEPGWVELLWQQMKARPTAAVVSVVNCIKDQSDNPRTSTAYSPKGQPWGATRFIRYQDRADVVAKHGPTFGPETCREGEVFLVNTGCMLIDLRRDCWDGFAWEQPAFVARRADGVWETAFEPEDWRMSRYLASKGIDYAATWAVRVVHHGAAQWPNY